MSFLTNKLNPGPAPSGVLISCGVAHKFDAARFLAYPDMW